MITALTPRRLLREPSISDMLDRIVVAEDHLLTTYYVYLWFKAIRGMPVWLKEQPRLERTDVATVLC